MLYRREADGDHLAWPRTMPLQAGLRVLHLWLYFSSKHVVSRQCLADTSCESCLLLLLDHQIRKGHLKTFLIILSILGRRLCSIYADPQFFLVSPFHESPLDLPHRLRTGQTSISCIQEPRNCSRTYLHLLHPVLRRIDPQSLLLPLDLKSRLLVKLLTHRRQTPITETIRPNNSQHSTQLEELNARFDPFARSHRILRTFILGLLRLPFGTRCCRRWESYNQTSLIVLSVPGSVDGDGDGFEL